MEQKTKNQIREQFTKDIGRLLWEERRNNQLTLEKAAKCSTISRGQIDRIEVGCSHDLHLVFCLCAQYNKRIKVELID